MAKTYEELKKLGWRRAATADVWLHPRTGSGFVRAAYESDAEFRERLERNTPGLEDFDSVTALRRLKNKRRRLQEELQLLEREIEPLTQRVREESLWKITDMPEMDWSKMMDWAKDNPEIADWKAASHGNRVEFFGFKEWGSPLIAVAIRVGWPQDMEGDDE